MEVTFAEDIDADRFVDVDGVSDLTFDGRILRCRLIGEADSLVKAVSRHIVRDFISEEPDIEELFFHYYTGDERHAS